MPHQRLIDWNLLDCARKRKNLMLMGAIRATNYSSFIYNLY